jgi:hypothetical protein
MDSLRRSLTKPIATGHAVAREAVALSRNYRHAAVLRRQLRSTRGVAMTWGPSALLGEALTRMEHAPWIRLTVLIMLFFVAAVRNR